MKIPKGMEAEYEADKFACMMLLQNDVCKNNFITVFVKLEILRSKNFISNTLQFFDEHPSNENRIKAIEKIEYVKLQY